MIAWGIRGRLTWCASAASDHSRFTRVLSVEQCGHNIGRRAARRRTAHRDVWSVTLYWTIIMIVRHCDYVGYVIITRSRCIHVCVIHSLSCARVVNDEASQHRAHGIYFPAPVLSVGNGQPASQCQFPICRRPWPVVYMWCRIGVRDSSRCRHGTFDQPVSQNWNTNIKLGPLFWKSFDMFSLFSWSKIFFSWSALLSPVE